MNKIIFITTMLVSQIGVAEDTITLKSGTVINGDVTHFKDGKFTINLSTGKTTTTDLSTIEEIDFGGITKGGALPKLPEANVVVFKSLKEIIRKIPRDLQPHNRNKWW